MNYKHKYLKYIKKTNISNNMIGGENNNIGFATYDFGTNNYEYSGKKINKKSVFQCASLSKQIFAIIVLKMSKDKKIELNKNIYDYLTSDELNILNINKSYDKRYKNITIKMLLTHTSGLPNGNPDNLLSFDPGTNYGYSGNGFNLLQKIVEKIEKKTLNEIYNDYKMSSSSFIYENKFNKKLALPYDNDKTEKSFRNDMIRPYSAWSLYSNLEDFVYLLKENNDIVRLMAEEQFKINKHISVGIGCLLYDGYIWQYGDNYFYKNFLLYNPNNNAGFISLSNNTKGWTVIKNKIPKHIAKFMISNEYKDKNIFE